MAVVFQPLDHKDGIGTILKGEIDKEGVQRITRHSALDGRIDYPPAGGIDVGDGYMDDVEHVGRAGGRRNRRIHGLGIKAVAGVKPDEYEVAGL